MQPLRYLSVPFTALFLAGCANAPLSTRSLPWQDAWGDRGVGVRDRDLMQCAEAVEQRRSALAGCMERKGWLLAP
ncbi:hypothetical protein [Variovorax ginsengisoli]|uniref:PBP1b-binding outer membrane lipoprotein LpoB n=1 Tax=Variovorax ginsengisoli TaxID=363844 RepID=A0ABT9SF14_9BURK|nr:hypothetical protein [Variovorax ginsengisoli]MDP9902953.1 PBP1b-binding outer membrane lipoprotein LpoB [Variovorax ginsengisoli]